jgi:hypothetical protein
LTVRTRKDEIPAIRMRDCPKCGAHAGSWCTAVIGTRAPIIHAHAERIAAFRCQRKNAAR